MGAEASVAAAGAAMANAVKAMGAIVEVTPEDFAGIVNRADTPVVITASGGWLQKKHQYLTSYRGFIFYTRTDEELILQSGAEYIASKSIWIPG